MCVIGIITEYNPFHNGHIYQINEIKKLYPDAVIITVMSGNLVQRGELSLFPKEFKAKAAVMCGVDLVLELPSLFSVSSAERFAYSAVYILNSLGIVDYICFGSETGNIELIKNASEKLSSDVFECKLSRNVKLYKNLSYQKIVNLTYTEIFGDENYEVLIGSNDILGLEYLAALKKLDSDIVPFTVERTGEGYNSLNVGETVSATFIRNNIYSDLSGYLPEESYKIISEKICGGELFDNDIFGHMVLSYLKRLDAEEIAQYPDITGGFEHKIFSEVKKASSIGELYDLLSVKTYSKSRIRRTLLYIFFDIKKEDIQQNPQFTNFLAATKKGLEILNSIRKKSGIQIITKQYDFTEDGNVLLSKQLKKNIFIDDLCMLTLKNKEALLEAKKKPFIKS